ncbi:putative exported protein [Halobacteriovorax marinus SJ]|uniref:Exported protein n=1 Tax=Halobacteriovorax marinus (strain ATCC BAA-682 / DSM 15412 / SJ) TaxID=862908 RepID=E1WX82_HALMS|nr:DUF3750 domain-containing protein [Halobacteriovorax marinus]CBW25783.1 putative exported protein [Halobacteriovorax marinus SJ]
MKVLFLIITLFLSFSCSSKDWRSASRESANIAVKAHLQKEDIFQVYYARAFSWRGYFGIHPWVSWKLAEEQSYTVAQVTSWNIRRSGNAISVAKDLPDRKWYDNDPTLLYEIKGEKAREVIAKTKKLIEDYPHKKVYRLWPGPNSNTFVSHIIRNIEELPLELPSNGIGKDYLEGSDIISSSPSNKGFQFSAYGLFGLTLGVEEGFEVNILGLNFGLDPWRPALKLPFVGRLGFQDKAITDGQ